LNYNDDDNDNDDGDDNDNDDGDDNDKDDGDDNDNDNNDNDDENDGDNNDKDDNDKDDSGDNDNDAEDEAEKTQLQRSLSTGGCSITKYSSSHSFNPLMSSKSELNLSAKKVVSRLCVSCLKGFSGWLVLIFSLSAFTSRHDLTSYLRTLYKRI
jgi:hypothetical protein